MSIMSRVFDEAINQEDTQDLSFEDMACTALDTTFEYFDSLSSLNIAELIDEVKRYENVEMVTEEGFQDIINGIVNFAKKIFETVKKFFIWLLTKLGFIKKQIKETSIEDFVKNHEDEPEQSSTATPSSNHSSNNYRTDSRPGPQKQQLLTYRPTATPSSNHSSNNYRTDSEPGPQKPQKQFIKTINISEFKKHFDSNAKITDYWTPYGDTYPVKSMPSMRWGMEPISEYIKTAISNVEKNIEMMENPLIKMMISNPLSMRKAVKDFEKEVDGKVNPQTPPEEIVKKVLESVGGSDPDETTLTIISRDKETGKDTRTVEKSKISYEFDLEKSLRGNGYDDANAIVQCMDGKLLGKIEHLEQIGLDMLKKMEKPFTDTVKKFSEKNNKSAYIYKAIVNKTGDILKAMQKGMVKSTAGTARVCMNCVKIVMIVQQGKKDQY